MNDYKTYAQTAEELLLASKTNCREFDNCFENFCGDDVVRHLMRKATAQLPPMPPESKTGYLPWSQHGMISKLHQERNALAEAIKRAGLWDTWMAFYQRELTEFKQI